MFYLIDKPLGLTSFDVIRILRKKLNIKKMGHVGTLDPLATGCLLIATENSTKLIPLLERKEKRYRFIVDISGKTASLDLGTEKTDVSYNGTYGKNSEDLREFLTKQKRQIPPTYSALHIHGKRAYELARAGVEIKLKEREIDIKDVILHSFSPPFFDIELTISSGGYIRSLAPVIGKFFGIDGGYITALRRVSLILSENTCLGTTEAQILEDFSGDTSLTYEKILPEIEIIMIHENTLSELKLGKIIPIFGDNYRIGQKYLLNFENKYVSLVEYQSNGFRIIKNDV